MKFIYAQKNWPYAYNNLKEELSELQRHLSREDTDLKQLNLSEYIDPMNTSRELSQCIDVVKKIEIPEGTTIIEDKIAKVLKGRFLSDAEYFQEHLHAEMEAMGMTTGDSIDF
jgi:hypothetical protein